MEMIRKVIQVVIQQTQIATEKEGIPPNAMNQVWVGIWKREWIR